MHTHTLQRTCTEFAANFHRTYYRTNTVLTQHLHTADTELTQKLRRTRTERVRIFPRRHTAPAKSPNRTYAEHLHKRHVGMHTHISLALTRERATSAPIHTECQPRLRARARGVKHGLCKGVVAEAARRIRESKKGYLFNYKWSFSMRSSFRLRCMGCGRGVWQGGVAWAWPGGRGRHAWQGGRCPPPQSLHRNSIGIPAYIVPTGEPHKTSTECTQGSHAAIFAEPTQIAHRTYTEPSQRTDTDRTLNVRRIRTETTQERHRTTRVPAQNRLQNPHRTYATPTKPTQGRHGTQTVTAQDLDRTCKDLTQKTHSTRTEPKKNLRRSDTSGYTWQREIHTGSGAIAPHGNSNSDRMSTETP